MSAAHGHRASRLTLACGFLAITCVAQPVIHEPFTSEYRTVPRTVPPMPPVREVEMEKIIRRIASDVLLVTNAKESVSVVTNVVESSNERGCQTCEMQRLHPELNVYHPPHAGGLPYIAATEKYRTTICKQLSILTFTWRGVDRSMMEEQILWQTNQVWMLKSEWEEVPAPAPSG